MNVRKMAKLGKIDEFIGMRKLELTEDKIRSEKAGMASEATYDCVKSIESDDGRLFIFVGGMTAFIVPFAAFADENEKREFLEILEKRTEKQIK